MLKEELKIYGVQLIFLTDNKPLEGRKKKVFGYKNEKKGGRKIDVICSTCDGRKKKKNR